LLLPFFNGFFFFNFLFFICFSDSRDKFFKNNILNCEDPGARDKLIPKTSEKSILEEASGGSIFFRDIECLPMDIQEQLAQILADKQIQPQ